LKSCSSTSRICKVRRRTETKTVSLAIWEEALAYWILLVLRQSDSRFDCQDRKSAAVDQAFTAN
jgi:hypothetical protein